MSPKAPTVLENEGPPRRTVTVFESKVRMRSISETFAELNVAFFVAVWPRVEVLIFPFFGAKYPGDGTVPPDVPEDVDELSDDEPSMYDTDLVLGSSHEDGAESATANSLNDVFYSAEMPSSGGPAVPHHPDVPGDAASETNVRHPLGEFPTEERSWIFVFWPLHCCV